MAQVIDGIEYEVNADTKGLGQSTAQVDTSTKKMEGSFKRLDTQVSKTAKGVKDGLQKSGNIFQRWGISASNAGFQVQDAMVQAQAGVSGFTIAAQQLPQLLPGVAGAFVAIAAVIGGVFYNALTESEEATKDLADELRELVKTTTLTEAQYKVLAQAEEDGIEATRKLRDEKKEEVRQLRNAVESGEAYNKAVADGTLRINAATKAGMLNADSLDENRKNLILAEGQLDTYNQTVEQAEQRLKKYQDALTGGTTRTGEQEGAVKNLIEALEFQLATLGASGRAIALHTAYLNNATQAEYDQINAIYDSIEAHNARKNAMADPVAESDLSIEQILGYQQYYQSRVDGEAEVQKAVKKTAQTSQQAMQAQANIANSLLSSVQGVTSGILASLDEQSTAYKIAFAVQKAAAAAQAIVAAESAAAQVLAHDAGILGLGAVASSNLVRSLGYASAGVIAGTAISGGRQYGGPTNAGGIYQTGELNHPEMLTEGGKQYLIPGNRGNVTPLEGVGGTTNVSVTVNNLPGQDARVSESGSGPDRQLVIDIINAEALNPGSRLNQNLRKTNTLSPRQGATRRTGQ